MWLVPRCLHFAPFIGALSVTTNTIAASRSSIIHTDPIILTFLVPVVVLIIRTYALYARATWVLILTSIVAGASIAISAVRSL